MTTIKTFSSCFRPSSSLLHCKLTPFSSLKLNVPDTRSWYSLLFDSHFSNFFTNSGFCFKCLCSRLRLIYSNPNPLRNLSLRSNPEFQKAAPLEMADKRANTALLVVDMQRDFLEDGGPMLVKGGKAIVPNVVKAVEVARQNDILIVWVVREHDPLGRDVELFRRHLYGAGVVGPTTKGSAGADLADGLVIREGDYKLVKTRFSAFFATHLHSFLQGAGINSLVVTGVQTPNCIRQTVFDAVALDYQPVTVIVDATAAATPDIHHANLFDMRNIGVATPTLQEWSNMFEA